VRNDTAGKLAVLLLAIRACVSPAGESMVPIEAGRFLSVRACVELLQAHGVKGLYADPRLESRQVYLPAGQYQADQLLQTIQEASGAELRRVGSLCYLSEYADGYQSAARRQRRAAIDRQPLDSVRALAQAEEVLGWLTLDRDLVDASGFALDWFSEGRLSAWSQLDDGQRARLEPVLARLFQEQRIASSVEPDPARHAELEEDRSQARRFLNDDRLTVRFLRKYKLTLCALGPAPKPPLLGARAESDQEPQDAQLYAMRACVTVPLW